MPRDRHRRFLATCPVEIGLPDGLLETVTEDVGHGGLYVESPTPLEVGQEILAAVRLQDGRRVPLPCRVVHALSEEVARSIGRSPGMGLDIIGEPPADWAAFVETLRDHQAPVVPEAPLSIVVLDCDLSLRDRVEPHLATGGFIVRGASSVSECVSLCREDVPDIVLADTATQGSNPTAVMKELGAEPGLADVSVVLMSDDSDAAMRLQSYRRGVRDFIPKPFTDEELAIRLRRVGPRGGRSAGRVAFRGVVEDVSLPMVLSLLEYERKSGTLVVMRASQIGRMFVASGKVHRVELPGHPESVAALYEMLSWRHGSFGFLSGTVAMPNEVNIPTQHLLLEHARKSDEAMRQDDDSEE